MKKLLYDVHSTDELLKVQEILKKANIDYEAKTKATTMLKSLLNMFFYHVLSSGIERRNETIGIYVEESSFEAADALLKKYLH